MVHNTDLYSAMTETIPGTQAVGRALQLLRAVAQSRQRGTTLAQLVRDTGLNKPTAHRLLQALAAEGLIEQDDQSARYFVGPQCYVLGNIASERFGLGREAADSAARLARISGDSAFFSIRSDIYALCVLREDGDYPLKTHVLQPGARHPLGVGAGSLAMLAALDDAEVDRCLVEIAPLLRERYPSITETTLRREIHAARQRGYAVNEGMVLKGSWGIGVAVRGPAGDVVGALSIAAIQDRLPPARQRELGGRLCQERDRLARHLATAAG